MNLRRYQRHAIDSTTEAFRDSRSALLVLATGTGKTVIFSTLAHEWQDRRVMVVAHREELVRQAADKIERITGEHPDIEMADEWADDSIFRQNKIVVSSVQTLNAGSPRRLSRFRPDDFGLIVVDEAHHATADTYRRVIGHFDRSKILGVTATPDRSDEEALGRVFETVPFCYEMMDGIRDGYLVPIKVTTVNVKDLDYSEARDTAGDLNQQDVAKIQGSERVLHEIVDPIVAIAGNRKTIVFATPGYAGEGEDEYHVAERMTEIINRHKPGSAVRVSQDTPKDLRREYIRQFAEGRIQFLVNVGVLTEGFDDPTIEVVAITRPTKSRSLYAQMVGRGTRPIVADESDDPEVRRRNIAASIKPHVEVVDVCGISGKHKLISPTDILGKDDEVAARAKVIVRKNPEITAERAIEQAEEEIKSEKELKAEQVRKSIIGKARFSVAEIDPFDALDIAPVAERGWDRTQGPTTKQLDILVNHGIRPETIKNKRQASVLIDEISRRRSNGLAGFKLAARLRERGLPTNVSIGEAMNLLTRSR